MEERLKEVEEGKEERKKEVEKEKEDRGKEVAKEKEERKKEVEKEKEERKNEVQKEKEERKKEVEEERRGWERTLEERRNSGGESRIRNGNEEQRQPHVLIVDSNGRGATPDSVRNHIPREKRGKYEKLEIHTAYTTDEAVRRVGDDDINVKDAIVVLDNLTNDVRGTRHRPAVSPTELVRRVDQLRRKLQAAGAARRARRA